MKGPLGTIKCNPMLKQVLSTRLQIKVSRLLPRARLYNALCALTNNSWPHKPPDSPYGTQSGVQCEFTQPMGVRKHLSSLKLCLVPSVQQLICHVVTHRRSCSGPPLYLLPAFPSKAPGRWLLSVTPTAKNLQASCEAAKEPSDVNSAKTEVSQKPETSPEVTSLFRHRERRCSSPEREFAVLPPMQQFSTDAPYSSNPDPNWQLQNRPCSAAPQPQGLCSQLAALHAITASPELAPAATQDPPLLTILTAVPTPRQSTITAGEKLPKPRKAGSAI